MTGNSATTLHANSSSHSQLRIQWNEVGGFVAFAYAISWLWWTPLVWPRLGSVTWTEPLPNVFAHSGPDSMVALGMFGPAMAALVMGALAKKRARRLPADVRRRWPYYATGVLAPVLFVAAVVTVDVASGLGRFVWPRRPLLAVAVVLFVNGSFTLPLAIGEEYGWRGYLLPRLLPLGEQNATLLVAAIWGLWHLPILLVGLNYPGQPLWTVLPVFLGTITLTAFPFTWLYLASEGSVLAVALMHAELNAFGDTFTSPRYIPDGNPLVVGGGGLVAAALLMVIVTVITAIRRSRLDAAVPQENSAFATFPHPEKTART